MYYILFIAERINLENIARFPIIFHDFFDVSKGIDLPDDHFALYFREEIEYSFVNWDSRFQKAVKRKKHQTDQQYHAYLYDQQGLKRCIEGSIDDITELSPVLEINHLYGESKRQHNGITIEYSFGHYIEIDQIVHQKGLKKYVLGLKSVIGWNHTHVADDQLRPKSVIELIFYD